MLVSPGVAIAGVLVLVVSACSTPGNLQSDAAAPEPGTSLVSGTFEVAAADAFGDPGFHDTIAIDAVVPDDVEVTSGRMLTLALRDLSRPDVECDSQHPLSGCATIDWSDSPTRPNVSEGGVFENSITLTLADGEATLFLREGGTLALEPEEFDPG